MSTIKTVSSITLSRFNRLCNDLLSSGYVPHNQQKVETFYLTRRYVQQYIKYDPKEYKLNMMKEKRLRYIVLDDNLVHKSHLITEANQILHKFYLTQIDELDDKINELQR